MVQPRSRAWFLAICILAETGWASPTARICGGRSEVLRGLLPTILECSRQLIFWNMLKVISSDFHSTIVGFCFPSLLSL